MYIFAFTSQLTFNYTTSEFLTRTIVNVSHRLNEGFVFTNIRFFIGT